jgi:hypothetical protein
MSSRGVSSRARALRVSWGRRVTGALGFREYGILGNAFVLCSTEYGMTRRAAYQALRSIRDLFANWLHALPHEAKCASSEMGAKVSCGHAGLAYWIITGIPS